MIDLVQLQNDIYGLLLSAPELSTVNIVLERKFMVDDQVNLDAIWQTPRNERSGNGLLVEMPKTKVNTAVTEMPQDVTISVVAFQNGDAALTPETGGGHFAENLAQLALFNLHLQAIGGIGTLKAVGTAPASEYDFVNGQRATWLISAAKSITKPRCAIVAADVEAGQATLTCTTADVDIFYTLDGSTPVDPELTDALGNKINPNAVKYTVPFAVSRGQKLRTRAQRLGYNHSTLGLIIIP